MRTIEVRLQRLEAQKTGTCGPDTERIIESIRFRHQNPKQALAKLICKYHHVLPEDILNTISDEMKALIQDHIQPMEPGPVVKRIVINTIQRELESLQR